MKHKADIEQIAPPRHWREWVLLLLALVNGLSGLDGHKPEHYVAGAIFAAAYFIISALRARASS